MNNSNNRGNTPPPNKTGISPIKMLQANDQIWNPENETTFYEVKGYINQSSLEQQYKTYLISRVKVMIDRDSLVNLCNFVKSSDKNWALNYLVDAWGGRAIQPVIVVEEPKVIEPITAVELSKTGEDAILRSIEDLVNKSNLSQEDKFQVVGGIQMTHYGKNNLIDIFNDLNDRDVEDRNNRIQFLCNRRNANNVNASINSNSNLGRTNEDTYTKKETLSSSAQTMSPLDDGNKALNNILSEEVSNYVSTLIPEVEPQVVSNIIEEEEPIVQPVITPEEHELIQAMEVALSALHKPVAEAIAIMLRGRCFSSTWKGDDAFFWREDLCLWIDGNTNNLANFIMNEPPEEYTKKANILIKQAQESSDQKFIEGVGVTVRRIGILVGKLAQQGYCRAVAGTLRDLVYCDEFLDKLDSNRDILPIRGRQVVDFRARTIRKRTMGDYCSYECKISYNPNDRCPKVEEFLNCFTCYNKELLDYLQVILGLCLTGRVKRQIYILWGPGGRNGKSTLMNMMEKVLNRFYVQGHRDLVVAMASSSKDPNKPSPALAQLKGARMVVISEPDAAIKMDIEQIKSFTGEDTINARHLNAGPIQFKPQFKPFLLCNEKPDCGTDEAFWKRMVFIPCKCEFTENPDPVNYKYPLDVDFISTITQDENSMNAFFNWLLVGAFNGIAGNIKVPEHVTKATNKYKGEQDIYAAFVNDCIDLYPGSTKEFIAVTSLNSAFSNWYSGAIGGPLPVDRVKNIKRVLGDQKTLQKIRCYGGCKLKQGVTAD